MPLHPKIRSALQAAEGQPPLETQPIAEARAQAKASYAPTVPVPVSAVEDIVLSGGHGGIRARLYTPAGTGRAGRQMIHRVAERRWFYGTKQTAKSAETGM